MQILTGHYHYHFAEIRTLIKNADNICIGSNVHRLRIKKHMKSSDLVREVNLLGADLNLFALSKIEANTQHVKASQFKAFMQILDCTAEELLKPTVTPDNED